MKSLKFAIVGVGIMTAAFFAGRILWPQKDLNAKISPQETPAPQDKFAPQTNSEGAVSVSVAPKNSLNSDVWEFEVSLDTHTVELNEELETATLLIDESGNEYRPLAWEGDPPGGHHRGGILKFDPIIPRPDVIKLKISGIGGVAERMFVWNIGG